jgi:hypothetical protein
MFIEAASRRHGTSADAVGSVVNRPAFPVRSPDVIWRNGLPKTVGAVCARPAQRQGPSLAPRVIPFATDGIASRVR